jgi:uncharacterized membrane protein
MNTYKKLLKLIVNIVEILTYTIAITIITFSIFNGIYIYIIEFNYPEKSYNDTRNILGNAISLALSFILCIEVLKIFYIQTYHQLVMLVTLILLKIIIGYYLDNQKMKITNEK